MIEPTLSCLPVPSSCRALRLDTRRNLAWRPAERVAAIAGPANTEHEEAQATALEAKLLVVVHRLLPRRRKTCSGCRRRASCAQSRRPSAEGLELVLGALDLFGVLAEPDRNGEIFEAASFAPTGSTVRTRRNQAAINTHRPAVSRCCSPHRKATTTHRGVPAFAASYSPSQGSRLGARCACYRRPRRSSTQPCSLATGPIPLRVGCCSWLPSSTDGATRSCG